MLLMLICSLFLVSAIFWDLKRRVATGVVLLSPILYFAVLWWLAFPFHAYLLSAGLVDTQQQVVLSQRSLLFSVVTSMLCLLLVWWGARSTPRGVQNVEGLTTKLNNGSPMRVGLVIALLIALAIAFLGQTVLNNGEWAPFVGNEQNESRVGSGPLFMMSELFIYGLIAATPAVLKADWRLKGVWFLIVIYGAGLTLAVGMGIALTSRRVIALPFFALALGWMFTRRQVSMALATSLMAATFFAAPALQSIRYALTPTAIPTLAPTASHCKYLGTRPIPQRAVTILDQTGREREISNLEEKTATLLCASEHYSTYFFLQTIATSYGLSDHLATYFSKATITEIAFGVDHGQAWVYNAMLGLIPRAIWSEKPLHYGSVAEQKWLYPEMYKDNPITMTLPPSFVVDFLFGFGGLVAAVMSYWLGRFLGWTHSLLLLGGQEHHSAHFAFGLFTMAYLFNLVRGGTGFVQLVIMMLLVLVMMYGSGSVRAILQKANR